MSYDIRLKHTKTNETAVMKRPQLIRGGTVRAMYNEQTGQLEQAEQIEADINVTFNYECVFEDGNVKIYKTEM